MMEQFFTLLNLIISKTYPKFLIGIMPIDKYCHFITGYALGYAFDYSGYPIASSSAVSTIAAWKEYYDYKHPEKHTCDFWDWFATTLGGVFGAYSRFLITII